MHQVPLALAPTQMSGLAVLLGLLGLGALVFLLQRLRVRHRSQLVVTTLFWREALEESRARTLFERFRHPLTYLLLALICGLLWLSVARFEGKRDRGVQHTFLLDGSAGMAVGDRFERAIERLAEALEDAPRERTEVLLCGETVETILAPGDDRALLAARLGDIVPAAVPSCIDRTLAGAAWLNKGADRSARRFVVVGREAASGAAASLLPTGDWLEHLEAPALDASVAGNVGITAFGIAPAHSGAFDAVDALVEIRGVGAEAASVSVTLGGQPVRSAERRVTGSGAVEFLCRDLKPGAANGAAIGSGAAKTVRHLVATLKAQPGDALASDNRAVMILPELRLVRVRLVATGDAAVDSALRAACLADAAIEIVGEAARADITVGGKLAAAGPLLPSLTVSPSSAQQHAIQIEAPGPVDPEVLLADAVGTLGLDRIDATRLASELGKALSLGTALAERGQRSVSLWTELFDSSSSSFAESRAFPLVVGRTVRWLAGTPEIVPYAASGRGRPARLAQPATGRYPWLFLPRSGEPDVTPMNVNLLDPATTLLGAAGSSTAGSTAAAPTNGHPDSGGSGPWRLATWILAVVLALLTIEWALYQRGRIA